MATPPPPPSGRPRTATSPGTRSLPLPGTRLLYGADYNPEQWDPHVWREDVTLMHQAGVNTVSLGIWSWALVEPTPGTFRFGWLDEILDLLQEAGIGVDLATPTAAPPAWFYRAHPEACLVEADGTVRHGGSRGICCPHSPAYARAAERVTRALVEHVARRCATPADEGPRTAPVMWHVHNEYGAPGGDCHCECSQAAFRTWLRERYRSLEALNRAWGTTFWGQVYGDWEEVTTPRHSGTALNPACELDYARFTSDSLLARFTVERDIIRAAFPQAPVTTNFMATNCPANDYWRWASQTDVVSTDYYLEADSPVPQIWAALESDLTRSLAGGAPWLLMEHSVSAVSWQSHNRAKDPGQERRTALAHVARGADGVMAFQWRASRRGAEKFHSAMIPHAGADTRVFREVCELGAELAALSELRGTRVRARVALTWDWESFWAQDLAWRPSSLMSHREQVRTTYRWLWERGTTVDLAHPEADLSGYDVVIAPASYLVSQRACENLATFVKRGGRLAALPFFAVVDAEECVHRGGAPGPLRDVLGLSVEEIRPVPVGQEVHLAPTTWGEGRAVSASPLTGTLWSEDLRLEGAEPVWTALDGPTPGPAVTAHRYGQGLAVYVSVLLDGQGLARVLEPLLNLPTDRPVVDGGARVPGLEAVTRYGVGEREGTTYTILVNHDGVAHTAALAGTDVLTGEELDSVTLPAGDVRVVRSQL